MAAASVPLEHRRRVIIWGTAAAVVLRIAFALVTTQLLQIIGLTLAGGLLLAFVAYQMYRVLRTHGQNEVTPDEALEQGEKTKEPKTVAAAVWKWPWPTSLCPWTTCWPWRAPLKDHLEILVAGLVISIIMTAFAANFIAKLIHKHRWVAWVGLLIIAYVALDMIWRGWIQVAAAVS